MSFDYRITNNPYYNYNPYFMGSNMPNFNAKKNPVEKIQKNIEKQVDAISTETSKEENKKSNAKAIALGITGALITAGAFILNPKRSPKLMAKLKDLQIQFSQKAKQTEESFVKSKLYSFGAKAANKTGEILNFSNNFNSIKDIYCRDLLTKPRNFNKVKNEKARNFLANISEKFTGVMNKVYSGITNWFDNISKKTVKGSYKSVNKKIDKLNNLIKTYGENLDPANKQKLEELLKRLEKERASLSESKILERLKKQENLMEGLEEHVNKAFKEYRKGIKPMVEKPKKASEIWENTKHSANYAYNNLHFWAEDALATQKKQVIKEGNEIVGNFFNSEGKKGIYDQIDDIFKENISTTEYNAYHKRASNLKASLKKANHTENFEYFDKKRDLELGGGPTDILGSLATLGLSGALIARAKDNDKRREVFLTEAAPLVVGIGTSLAFTAMLFSGVKGLLAGAASTVILGKLGQIANKQIAQNKNNNSEQQGVIYA